MSHPFVQENLRQAPAGHEWRVCLVDEPELSFAEKAPLLDPTATALVRSADNLVVETWRSGELVGLPIWIRNDAHIPAAQAAIDSDVQRNTP